jgi:hypothetical protein
MVLNADFLNANGTAKVCSFFERECSRMGTRMFVLFLNANGREWDANVREWERECLFFF